MATLQTRPQVHYNCTRSALGMPKALRKQNALLYFPVHHYDSTLTFENIDALGLKLQSGGE